MDELSIDELLGLAKKVTNWTYQGSDDGYGYFTGTLQDIALRFEKKYEFDTWQGGCIGNQIILSASFENHLLGKGTHPKYDKSAHPQILPQSAATSELYTYLLEEYTINQANERVRGLEEARSILRGSPIADARDIVT
ncbi:MAG: hypothetical protein ABIJ21_04510 [Nanoarchaeota archaeon]